VLDAGRLIGIRRSAMEKLKEYRDYETISEKLMKGECPPEMFLLLVGWASGEPVSTEPKRDTTAGNAKDWRK
jgi:hypothetical protein